MLGTLTPLDDVYVYDVNKNLIRIFRQVGTNEVFFHWIESLSNEVLRTYTFVIVFNC